MADEQALTSWLEPLATARDMADGRQLMLSQPGRVVYVAQGWVNLFAAQFQDGRPERAPRFLGRVSAGGAVMGLPGDGPQGGLGLVLISGPETRLLELDQAQLLRLWPQDEHAPWVAALLEAILRTMWSALDLKPPAGLAQLGPGQEQELAQESGAQPSEGLVWVRPLEGDIRPGGDQRLPLLPHDKYLPLAPGAFVMAETAGRLAGLATPDYLAQDPAWSGLETFLSLVAQRLHLDQDQDTQSRRDRLERQSQLDQAVLQEAYAQIASVLGPEATPLAGEAGMADALLAACRILGRRLDINFQPASPPAKGTPPGDPLTELARSSGVKLRRVALKGQWWREDNGPLLGFTKEDKQPVALLPLPRRRYAMINPRDGVEHLVGEEEVEQLDYFAVVFYRPFPSQAMAGRDMIRFALHGLKGDLNVVLWLGVVVGLLGMITPMATGVIYSDIIPYSDRSYMYQIAVILVVGYLATAAFTFVRNIAVLRAEGRVDSAVQSALWDRLLNLPADFFRRYSAGDLAYRALGINAIRELISGAVSTTLIGGLFSSFNLVLLFYYDWKLALVALVIIAVGIACTILASFRQLGYQRQAITIQGNISGLVQQLINGLSKLRLGGAENRAFAVWAERFSDQKRQSYKAGKIATMLAAFNDAFPVLATALLFTWIIFFTDKGAMDTGDFLAFNSAFVLVLTAAIQMSATMIAILNVVPFYERLKPIIEEVPEVDESKGRPGQLSGRVEVHHLSFRYDSDGPLALDDVSLRLEPGEFVAVVGPSGSGKSTLLRMLLGFEKPQSGAIFYDQFDLNTVDVIELRRQIGVVLQNAQVMPGDVFSNIVGSAPLSQNDAWEAAAMAGLDQDIKSMPMGMHTMVSEGGTTLSGGQRQRLLIARALVRRPKLIFFDEATSALDNRTQAVVSQSLEKLKATRLVIAHRLSTIANADRIVVLEQGKVVQIGSYDELMQADGLFAELARRQLA